MIYQLDPYCEFVLSLRDPASFEQTGRTTLRSARATHPVHSRRAMKHRTLIHPPHFLECSYQLRVHDELKLTCFRL